MSGTADYSAKRNEQILVNLLKEETNKYCADCSQKGTRWASWNLGVFLCIRCGGLHRKLGTHISKVKSVNLDKWTDEQVQNMVENGNSKVNSYYNPNPERYPFPTYSGDMEQYIRDKYEKKLFVAGASGATERKSSIRSATSTYSGSMGRDSSSVSSSQLQSTITRSGLYAAQQRQLQEMGFRDTHANMKVLQLTKGNVQEAVENLISIKTSGLSISSTSPPPAVTKSNPRDELVSIFGPPATTSVGNFKVSSSSQVPSTSHTGLSLLDTNFEEVPSPPKAESSPQAATGWESEEFDEFESAPPAITATATSFKSNGFSSFNGDSGKAVDVKNTPSFDEDSEFGGFQATNYPATGPYSAGGFSFVKQEEETKEKKKPNVGSVIDPWANPSNSGTSSNPFDAFDDIDPFKGMK